VFVTDDAPSQDFLARAEELCDALYADVQELRRAAALPPRERRALLDRAFRDAHTLKGVASALPQLAAAGALAHELENLLEAMRDARGAPGAAAIDACEDAADVLARAVESASRDAPAPDASDAVARLRRLAASLTGGDRPRADDDAARACDDEERRAGDGASPPARDAGPGTPPGPARTTPDHPRTSPGRSRESSSEPADDSRAAVSLTPLPADIDTLLNAEERRRIGQVRAEGARLLLCEVAFDLSDFDERFRRLTDALAESSEIVSTLPAAPGATPAARIGFRLLCAADEPGKLSPLAAEFGARLTELSAHVDSPVDHRKTGDGANVGAQRSGDADDGAGDGADGDTPGGDSPAGGAQDQSRAGDAASSSFVRVQLSELDELIFAANELFDDAMRALDAARVPPPPADPAGGETAARVRRDLVALVERVMALRMQPIGRTLERAARAARVAARRAGKRVEFEFAGGEARVDRAVAERLVAPLEHLLRNAVAHGIESPAERRKAGKDSRGRVRVEASAEGSRVRVTVADDGRGVDAARVERAARAQGLVAEGARLTQEHALRLIFRPGFSTADEVSQSAGRGVGLDAVEHGIESAGGEVRVRTRQGGGTTFDLRLPLALALVPAVVARAGRHAYAIDARHVVGTLARDGQAAEGDGARRTIRWRGSRLPLVSLREVIGQGASASAGGAGRDEAPRVIVVSADDVPAKDLFDEADAHEGRRRDGGAQPPTLVAVEVDQLIGRREVLVRTLGRHAKRWRGVAGAIDLRDGTVALLLDPPRLLES
jgi:two-component system chemotaxis sensor kinase CheA